MKVFFDSSISMDFVSILSQSEHATSELFAIYIQNYANQECN